MGIWMVLLKILIGIVSFFVLSFVLFGIEWVFEKFFIFLKECSFGYVIDKIFHILGNYFVILALIVLGMLLILLMYGLGDVLWDVLWKLI